MVTIRRTRGRMEVVERERQLAFDQAADAQAPVARHIGHVEVDQEVVQPDRRDVVAKRLERHPVVAGGELQFVQRNAHTRPRRTSQARSQGSDPNLTRV
jgi:hypothetical protein